MSTLKSSAEDLTLNADGSGNDVIIQSDGSTKAIVTAEGNVGIGVTPDAWNSNLKAIQVGDYGSINEDTGSKTFDIRCNSYQSASADVHTNTDEATMFRMGGGNYHFYQAVSASADATASWTEPLRIDTSGDVQVKTGNLVIGTSGKGIDFSATSDGTTMSSELLDDYEEGTWTPTITCSTSGSYTVDTGANALAYTKVGRVVHIQGGVNIASESSPNGNIRMSLPFTPFSGTKDSDYCMGNAMLTNHGGSLPNNADLFISGADYASLFSVADDGGTQYLDHDDVDTAFTIIFSMTYIAS
jgi:hypothetical protein